MNYVYENDRIHESADENESEANDSRTGSNRETNVVISRNGSSHDQISIVNPTISRRSYPAGEEPSSYDLQVEVIESNSEVETSRILQNYGLNINTHVTRRTTKKYSTDYVPTYEQRVSVRCLQPPPIEIGRRIIRRVQRQAPQKKIIIREKQQFTTTKCPLVLRERPPIPPTYTEDEIVEEELPPIEGPPIVVLERYAAPSEQPRDIHIERWCDYQVTSGSTTVIDPEPILMKQEPTLEIVEYEPGPAKVIRKFERLGISRENPKAYESLFGSMLLDRATLEQRALEAGVTENIACECPLAALNDTFHESAPLKYVEERSFHGEYEKRPVNTHTNTRSNYASVNFTAGQKQLSFSVSRNQTNRK